jgi:hypothetical protein
MGHIHDWKCIPRSIVQTMKVCIKAGKEFGELAAGHTLVKSILPSYLVAYKGTNGPLTTLYHSPYKGIFSLAANSALKYHPQTWVFYSQHTLLICK